MDPAPMAAERIRIPKGLPVWSRADHPRFERVGDFVHVIGLDGRQILVEHALVRELARCGEQIATPEAAPTRGELVSSWLVAFLLGVAVTILAHRGAWPW